jgi:tetratricopeptide (TPR) repeat protein
MFGRAAIVAVLGLFSVALSFVSNASQSHDETACFNGTGSDRIGACSRLIDDKGLDEAKRGIAFTIRCTAYVDLKKVEQAHRDCSVARRLAPEAPYTHFASYKQSFLSGDKRASATHLASYRAKLAEATALEEANEKDPLAAARLANLHVMCVSKVLGPYPEEVVSACDAFWRLSADKDDRALAAAVSCSIRTRLGDLSSAEKDCARSFESAPSSAYGHFARGYLRFMNEDYEGAVMDFRAAQAIGNLPREESEMLSRQLLVTSDLVAEATRIVAEAARKRAETTGPWERGTEQAVLAERRLKQTKSGTYHTAYDPLDPEADTQICGIEPSSPAGQQACLSRALRQTPNKPDLMIRLANLYAQSGNYAAAVKLWSRLIAVAPASTEFVIARCRVRFAWGQQLQAALKDCSSAISDDPKDHVPLELRASVYLRLKKTEAAIADYDDALMLHPYCSRCFYGRGLAKLQNGDANAMMKDVSEAKRLHPTIDKEFWDPYFDNAQTGSKGVP